MSFTVHDGDPVIGAVVLTAGAGGVVGVTQPDDNENVRAAIVRTPAEQLTDAIEAIKRGNQLEDRFIRYAEPLTDPGTHTSDLASNVVELLNGQFEVQNLYTVDTDDSILRLRKAPLVRESYRGTQFGQRAPFSIDPGDATQLLTPAYDHFVLKNPSGAVTQLVFRADSLTPDAAAAGSKPATRAANPAMGSVEIKLYIRALAALKNVEIYRYGAPNVQILGIAGPFDNIEITMLWSNVIVNYPGGDLWTLGQLSFNGAGVISYFNTGPV